MVTSRYRSREAIRFKQPDRLFGGRTLTECSLLPIIFKNRQPGIMNQADEKYRTRLNRFQESGHSQLLVIVQDRAEAATLGEQRIAAVAKQVQVERLIGLLLAVAVHNDRDRLRRFAGVEGQRTGLRDVVAV